MQWCAPPRVDDGEHFLGYKADHSRDKLLAVELSVVEVGGESSMQASDFTIVPVIVGLALGP